METKQSGFKVWLGLFVLLGLGLFIGGIFVIGKQKNMFNPVFKLSANFYNVGGLMVGNKVRFSGINVGTIDNITILNDTTVKVEMLVRKEIQSFIKVDCEAAIGSEGIIGDKVLNISQGAGSGKEVKDGQQLKSQEPVEMDAMMMTVKKTVDNLEAISYDFAALTSEVNDGQIVANIENMTQDFAQIAHNVNKGKGTLAKLIRDPSIANNLGQTIVNLKKSTKGLDENMEAAKHNFLFRGYYRRKERKAKEKLEKAEKVRVEELESKKKGKK